MRGEQVGAEQADVVEIRRRRLVVAPFAQHLLRFGLRQVDGDQAAVLVRESAHRAQQIAVAAVGAVRAEANAPIPSRRVLT